MWSDVTDATRNSNISTGHDLPIQINSVIKIIGARTHLPSPPHSPNEKETQIQQAYRVFLS